MRQSSILAAAFLLALATACGGGGGGDDSGTDPGVLPDVPADIVPDGAPDTADPGRDPAGETAPDPGPDTPACTCTAADECCDGCLPKNEGGTCGTAGPCETAGHCEAGTCLAPMPVACPPADTCHEGEGTCNPATGTCEYAAKADGADCEAVAGKDGSGYCLAGACLGFGACDHRAYDQPLGYACNFDGECASGRCDSWGDDWTAYCTAACGADLPACPEGMACVRVGESFACQPKNSAATLPGDASQGLFQVCNHDEDCAGGLCLGIDGKRFCADPCDDGTGKASAALCGSCGECRENGAELGFKHPFYCVPRGILTAGQPCAWAGECAKRYCHEGLCSEQCFVIEDLSSCPDNMDCVAGVFPDDPDVQVCVPKGETGRGFFQECLGDYACADERKCLAVQGVARCTAECSDEAPCATGTCVDADEGKRCVPSEGVGTAALGEACEVAWQCVEGLSCYAGACLEACAEDGTCPEGRTCFPDAVFQTYYCSPACGAEDPCPAKMACHMGTCVLTLDGGSFVHGLCRVDRDCETGNCRAGLCTESCGPSLPCEGAEAFEPVPFGLCQPCNPALYDSDCSPPDTFTLNTCITGIDGKSFCAEDCTVVDRCPPGTRCYSINGYQKACAPVALTCDGGIGCTADGACVRPQDDGAACADAAECRSGTCTDGVCGAPATCTVDADCGCDLLACDGGTCALAGGVLAEAEPNDEGAKAMALSGASGRVRASLYPSGDAPDVDLYRVTLAAGQALDVLTAPACGADADTLIRLLGADGTPIAGWENDDIDPNGYFFSSLVGYRPEAGGDVLVQVVQSPFVAGLARFPYVLEWRAYAVAANDTCAGAAALAEGETVADLSDGVDTYAAASCTGTPGFGRDLAWWIDVPAGEVLRASAFSEAADLQIYAVTDCAAAGDSCLAGADAVGGPGTESLIWWNRGAETVRAYLVVDSYYLDSAGPFALNVSVEPAGVPANDLPAGAVALASGVTALGTLVGAAGDADPGEGGCAGTALAGADVFYRLDLQAGDFLTVDLLQALGTTPNLWLTTDPATPAACLAAGPRFLSYAAPAEGPVTAWLVVDQADPAAYADFAVKATFGATGGCFGPCDSDAHVNACQAGALCTCNVANQVLEPVDCADLCRQNGATGGSCHAFTTPGFVRESCMCDYDCGDAALLDALCANGAYANCTCAASDPCGWQGDGTCDQFCGIEYPADSFDDTVDCTPAG